ncbi:MAG: CysO-cysteine peptidase [Verrucomicrobia subdivision 3 bacterium]|nr:CysO-cysteine peptidase [Limisphaerales bacterium]MCS1415957.1 CysO-cysteine peptidase [Limisphaerales bacterium]
MDRIHIPESILGQIHIQAIQDYPTECCGMILGPKDTNELTRFRACENAQDNYHALDPKTFPRTAKTAYFIEPKELLRIEKELSANNERIGVIYHSHIDVGAYFSEEDVRRAVADDAPIYPGTAYLVLSVVDGEIKGEKTFYWDPTNRSFVE